MQDEGWIKIHRKIRDWQHYGETSVLVVFIDLLLSAKSESGWVHGIKVERGQVLTSISRLMENTGLGSDNTVRRALKKLVESGEIYKKSTNSYTLITINQFDKYQCYSKNAQPSAEPTAQPTAQPTAERGAHIKESNNNTIITTEGKNIRSSSCLSKKQQQPTFEDVKNEIRVKGYIVDALKFYAYYEANGWVMKNNQPMKNWKAALLIWQKNELKEQAPQQPQTTTADYSIEAYKEHMKKYEPKGMSYEEYEKSKQAK